MLGPYLNFILQDLSMKLFVNMISSYVNSSIKPTSQIFHFDSKTLIFGMQGDLDLGWVGIVGQGRRSKVKVKCQNSCFDTTVTLLQDQGQRSGSRSKVKGKVTSQGQSHFSGEQRSILGARLWRVQ